MPSKRVRFTVQAFREKGEWLEPELPQAAADAGQAVRKAERLATGKAGAVAIRQDGDPSGDGMSDPVVLAVVGRVPETFLEWVPF